MNARPRGVMRSVGSVLAGVAARTGDLAARYGGEEFAVVLPGTNAIGARVVAPASRGGHDGPDDHTQ